MFLSYLQLYLSFMFSYYNLYEFFIVCPIHITYTANLVLQKLTPKDIWKTRVVEIMALCSIFVLIRLIINTMPGTVELEKS
jgi:hypothetical protein